MPRLRIDVERDKATEEALKKQLDARTVLGPAVRKLLTLINLGFKFGQSPYGQKWAPLKLRVGQPLRDTRVFQSSIVARFEGESATIGTNHIGARVHQFGATIRPVKAKMLRFFAKGSTIPIFRKSVKIPARPYFPLDASGNLALPATWEKAFLESVRATLEGKKATPEGGEGG